MPMNKRRNFTQEEFMFFMRTKNEVLSLENVKSVGRNIVKDNALYMIQSASYIEFNFVCKTLMIDLSAETEGDVRVAVILNDELFCDTVIKSSEGKKRVTVFDSFVLHYGTVKVIKLSESRKSAVLKVEGIILDKEARIYPTDNRKVRIEFIGDSMTCGYGVEDCNPENSYKVSTQNALKAYPFLTAEETRADFQVVAYSGYGLLTGFGKEEKCPEETVPEYYERIAKLEDGTVYDKWDFSNDHPDIVVINLGTNDMGYCNTPDKKSEFYYAYIEFIKSVRRSHPYAEILCMFGIMGNDLSSTIQDAVYNYSYDYRDEKIHFSEFEKMSEQDGYGANYHPSAITHQKVSMELVRVLRKYYDEKYKLS